VIYTKRKILECMRSGVVRINPFAERQLKANSYDVRLGNWFYYVKVIDTERVYHGPKWFDDNEKVPLPFGVGLLGMTKERIETDGDIAVQLRAKSTSGREFLTVCQDAGLGDIGYSNFWTTELSSHLWGTTYVKVGQEFGQVVFHATTQSDAVYDGQYATTEFPECMVPKKYRALVRPWNDSNMHVIE
jgi:dCTP deaminase